MQRESLSSRQTLAILGGAAVMLSLAMGMRQSWGLFQPHMIRDAGLTAADFSLAIAIQNILWGITQPFVGALADRHGIRPVVVTGVLVYAAGLAISLVSHSPLVFTLGAGLCIGTAMSCTGASIAMSITSRAVSPARRSLMASARSV
jgi:MFS family permease